MVIEREKGSSGIQKALTQLDLYHHSLRFVGEKMVSQPPGEAPSNRLSDLQEKSLGLIEDGHKQLAGLRDLLRAEDLDPWQSAMNRIGVAARRLSRASTQALIAVNTWRAVEAVDRFLATVSASYGHVRPGTEPGVEDGDGAAKEDPTLGRLFAEYEDRLAATASVGSRPVPPFAFGVLRWRGSQLFYLEKVEDGARWVELDPDYELQGAGEEPGGAGVAEARTIEGYPITLLLDTEIAEDEVDAYVHSQKGLEYFVSGYQVASEQQRNSRHQGKRRG